MLSLTLSPSRSHRTIHRCRGAIAPSIDVPPRRPSPSSRCPLPSIRPLLSSLCRAVHCRPSPSIVIVPSITVHHPSLLSLSCAVHCCPRRRAVAVHRPSAASVHCRCAVNRHLSSGWLLRFLSSRRRLLSTGSGFSARHVQPFSDA